MNHTSKLALGTNFGFQFIMKVLVPYRVVNLNNIVSHTSLRLALNIVVIETLENNHLNKRAGPVDVLTTPLQSTSVVSISTSSS